jgi:hypothetical protein
MPSTPSIPQTKQGPLMPSIPTPVKGNVDSMHDTMMAMKQAVEHLIGTRGAQPASRTFVQNTVPTAYNVGDHWVNSNNGKHSYWDGSKWLLTT